MKWFSNYAKTQFQSKISKKTVSIINRNWLLTYYLVIDQGVTLTYIQKEYSDTENDLDNIILLINETNLTRTEIEKTLKKHKPTNL